MRVLCRIRDKQSILGPCGVLTVRNIPNYENTRLLVLAGRMGLSRSYKDGIAPQSVGA